MAPFRIFLLPALAFLCLHSASYGQCLNDSPDPKPPNTGRIIGLGLEAIRERGWIEFAVYDDFPPYSWKDASGQVTGVDIEIGRLIASELGVRARFRLMTADETVEDDLRNHVWKGSIIGRKVSNVMLHTPNDPLLTCRVDRVAFTGKTYREHLAVAYRKDAYPTTPPTVAYFRHDTVAVENDSLADVYLSSLLAGATTIRRFATAAEAMTALRAGDVTAALAPRRQLEYGAAAGIAIHTPPLPRLPISEWTVGAGLYHAYRPLAQAIDDAIALGLRDGRIKTIFTTFGLTFSPPER